MKKLPIGLFGAGVIGRTHIERLARSDALFLCGIADPSDAAKALASSLLEATKPAAAIVATPNQLHVPQALDCLALGLPVLVEKPIAGEVAAAQTLVDAQHTTGVPVLIGHHRRHNPIIARGKAIIAQNTLGQVVCATAFATMMKPEGYFDVAWRRELGGGPILINLIHDIDMLRYLLGEVVSVQSQTSNQLRGNAVEDTAAAVLRFASGALCTVVVSDAASSPYCWDFCAGEQGQYPRQAVQSHVIIGTHGTLSLPDLAVWNYPQERHWHREMQRTQTNVHALDVYDAQLTHFHAVIERRTTPICDALDGLRTLQATLAVRDAAVHGGIVQL
jgi:predicted dehydrogenase